MGSLRKMFTLVNGKRVRYDSPEAKIARGEGRMVDGAYQAYSTADKQHLSGAETNKNAAYTDIASQSMLGRYSGNVVSDDGLPKKKKMAVSTLLGGSSVLGG